ncbi:DNA polymerase III subunit delta' [Sphingomonas colocasiae]|uniref:DNA polymerase III subunit delta n=1 Tax=Sphingomonas colocasiae TaxID=1848973 RepID=A0ABS7PJB9_9SPHN|nr:DNA polymerase III subunit delta' [Sphingomonas colocasiae]MBY8821393.1 DNA polymerase III subunit delta' [Sphingomonas colocasiae]
MTSLVGHAHEIAAFMDAMASGRLHHAWLLAGPQGVGKGRFADAAALRMLAEAAGPPPMAPGLEVSPDHPIARLIDAGSHPDFRRLQRLPNERTGDLARNIPIAQVRSLQGLFATTPSLSPRRVIVIDAIDDLERAAANALLKNLEEPPADTVFLLVSHAPGRLLPTIRSRCRVLRFGPLAPEEMASVLRDELPEADADEIAALVRVGEGAPGRALGFAGLDIAGLDQAMASIAATGDPAAASRTALAKALALKAAQPRYEAFLQRAPGFIATAARTRSGQQLADALKLWGDARDLAAGAVGLSLDPQSVVFELGTLIAGLARRRAA